MKLKKALALICALASVGVFTACGSDSSSTADSSSSSEAETTTEATTTEETSAAETTTTAAEPETAAIDENAITFDIPSLYTAEPMNDDGAAPTTVEVVSLNGDNKLRVHVDREDETKDFLVPKVLIHLPELIGVDKTGEIDHFSVDFTCISRGPFIGDDGTEMSVVGNFLGTLGGNIASEKVKDDEGNLVQNDWAQNDFSFNDWENAVANWHFETSAPLLPTNNYAANDEGVNLLIMRWGQPNAVDFYIDNLTIYDHDGKSIPIIYDAESNTVDVIEDDGKPYEVGGAADAGSTESTAEESEDSSAAESSEADSTEAAESSEE